MKYQITIQSNEGYSGDQVTGTTVRELLEVLRDLDPSDEIITFDSNNERGASFGRIHAEIDEVQESEE
jgi:hypothetical protein